MDEAYAIMNPSPKHYKFLFNVAYDEDTLRMGEAFVAQWLADHDYQVKRQKTQELKKQGMFQIKVWLQ